MIDVKFTILLFTFDLKGRTGRCLANALWSSVVFWKSALASDPIRRQKFCANRTKTCAGVDATNLVPCHLVMPRAGLR